MAALGLLATIALVAVLNPGEYLTRARLQTVELPMRFHGWLTVKSTAVCLGMIALFFSGQPVAKMAICADALLLLTRRIEPRKVYAEIDGKLLLMFAGLFIVVAMASTLAGNFTLLGSVANLIVAEHAARDGIQIGFGTYFRVGAPLTLITLGIGLWLLS